MTRQVRTVGSYREFVLWVARAKRKTLGRPRTDAEIDAKVRELAVGGTGKVRIARTLGIGVSVTQRTLAE